MTEPQAKQQTAEERVVYEPCPCREVVNSVSDLLRIWPAMRQHLTNSRIELLKAIRTVIDQRIEHLSSRDQKGTKLVVE